MSYILDALRKSELERQLLAGQSSSAPSLAKVRRNNRPRLMLWLLALAGIAGFGLILWILLPSPSSKKADVGTGPVTSAEQEPPEYFQPHKMVTETLPEHIVQGVDLTHAQPQRIIQAPHRLKDRPAIPAPTAIPDVATSVPSVPSVPKPTVILPEIRTEDSTVVKGDPLKGLPPMNISGYIHTAQGVGIAMINDKLVREGEEIYPGLRLIKVFDDRAVFNYKGYTFTR